MNLVMLLEMSANAFGDRIAIGSRDGSGVSYRDLFENSGRAAKFFRDGISERVSLIDTSSVALPVALFGSAWAGLPFVPLNYRLTEEEIQALAGEISPATAIVNEITRSGVENIAGFKCVSRTEFMSTYQCGDVPDPDWEMDPEQIAILLFTSGTTGAPKAAILRHSHLVSYILGSVEFMGAGEEEATLVSVPPYHIAGMAALCSSVYAGRRIVQLPNFDARQWIDLVIEEQITHAMVVPTMLSRIVEELEKHSGVDLNSLRFLSYGGGRMPRPVIEKALRFLPQTNFVNAYGLTETSSTISVLGPDDHRSALESKDKIIRRRLSSAGQPLPNIEVSIRDEEGKILESGSTGEIWVRGEQVSGEYLEHRTRVTDEGWFPTNDGGFLDPDGYLYVEGRMDDVIIRGGENISPDEIEEVILLHPQIKDVAVVGIPDSDWGEIVVAVVVPSSKAKLDMLEIQEFVRGRLRSSRTPDRVAIMDELPYNETGKLLRRVLRDNLSSSSLDKD
ncbi:MAG: class I adenylate-forming enzyme family protein [Acidimicrobiales bacterium]|nr:class I adenylate-forming enzyme family protein [Acidimicrobiales bacterium]